MTRVFSDVNFRRDFATRMNANEHDQSFDAFVRELRRSTECIDLDIGYSQIAEVANRAVPRNPSSYIGSGRWTELKNAGTLGLTAYGATVGVKVETYKSGTSAQSSG